jgi:hypothetical protein
MLRRPLLLRRRWVVTYIIIIHQTNEYGSYFKCCACSICRLHIISWTCCCFRRQVSPRQVDLRSSLVYETCMGRVGLCGVNAFHQHFFFVVRSSATRHRHRRGWSLASESNAAIKHRRETQTAGSFTTYLVNSLLLLVHQRTVRTMLCSSFLISPLSDRPPFPLYSSSNINIDNCSKKNHCRRLGYLIQMLLWESRLLVAGETTTRTTIMGASCTNRIGPYYCTRRTFFVGRVR